MPPPEEVYRSEPRSISVVFDHESPMGTEVLRAFRAAFGSAIEEEDLASQHTVLHIRSGYWPWFDRPEEGR